MPDDAEPTDAGLVIHEAQTIPDVGQTITFHGVRFEEVERERNRVTQMRLSKAPEAETED